jgi:hypothetical protein
LLSSQSSPLAGDAIDPVDVVGLWGKVDLTPTKAFEPRKHTIIPSE